MTAHTANPADGRFLHSILAVLIIAALTAGAVTAISIAKSEEPSPQVGRAAIVSQP